MLIVSKNGLLLVAAGGDVIHSTCVLYAKGARHTGTLAQKRGNVKTKDLTPNTRSSPRSHAEDAPQHPRGGLGPFLDDQPFGRAPDHVCRGLKSRYSATG